MTRVFLQSHIKTRLRKGIATGAMVDLFADDLAREKGARSLINDSQRLVPAAFLVELMTSREVLHGQQPRALKVRGARITGPLNLEGSVLSCPVLLQDCLFEETINLTEVTASTIRLPGCHVPGMLAEQLKTNGNLELNRGFRSHGEIVLRSAHIGGYLNLRTANLMNPGGRALSAELIEIDQNLYCLNGFVAEGQMSLRGARIHGQVHLSGARLTGSGGVALRAEVITVDQSFLCGAGDPFIADGEIQMDGARIGGVLDFSHATLNNPNGTALRASGLSAEFGIWCRDGFSAHGSIELNGARTGGVLDLCRAKLNNPGGYALFAEGLKSEYGVHCRQLTAQGEFRVAISTVGGEFDLSTATFANPGGIALNLEAAQISALLMPDERPDGSVRLTNARINSYKDDPTNWPDEIQLRGFVYNTLEDDNKNPRERLWLMSRRAGSYTPQIYDQLAVTYRAAGQEDAARKVAIAKQWRRRTVMSPPGKLANWLLYITVGYGYRNWFAGVWLVALTVLGWRIFSLAYPVHMIATKSHPPAFHPIAYTLDVLLPIIDLGQQNAWQAQGYAMYWSWVFISAGWLLTTAVVAGLTGILNRNLRGDPPIQS